MRCNIILTYRPPHSDLSNFLSIFDSVLHDTKSAIVLGDFNVNLLDNSVDAGINNYVSACYANGYFFLNRIDREYATHVSNSVSTIIDHCSTDLSDKKFAFYLQDSTISDHRMMVVMVSLPRIDESPPSIATKYVDYEGIGCCIDTIVQLPSIESMMARIGTIIEENTTTLTRVNGEGARKPWVNRRLIALIRGRDHYHRLRRKYPSNGVVFISWEQCNLL